MTPAEDHHEQAQDTPPEPGSYSTPSIQQNLGDRPPDPIQQSSGDTTAESNKPEKERNRLERIQLYVSIAGVVILIFYTGFTAWLAFLTRQSVHVSEQMLRTTEHAQKLHLNPELVCFLGNIRDQFPMFFLENEGKIDAESVSVDHLTFRYAKTGEKAGQMTMSGGWIFPSSQLSRPGFRWLYVPKLRPHERSIEKQTGEFVPPPTVPESENEIAILFFKVSYLRPTDGYLYEKRCVFYKDGDGYHVPQGFKSNPHFDGVNKELERSWAKISDQITQGPYLLRQ